MKPACNLLVVTVFLLIPLIPPLHADGIHPRGVKLDGTIGSSGNLDLPGPDYDIRAEYGEQAGANLFHSFHQFNIHADESAAFSGPDSVKNIISRVTGGDMSWIDGALRSAIPEADLYMLNPAGVMFGPNASLDLGGSFHISTADYLKLGENEQFFAEPLESGVLSTSAPSAFGFLDDTPGDISASGTYLKVPDGKTLSAIGGNIEMYNSTFYAREGRINLAGTGSAGEVRMNPDGLETGGFDRLGNIDILRDTEFLAPDGGEFLADLEVSGMGDDRVSGSVHIRGEQFLLSGGRLDSWNYGPEPGGDISIRITDTMTLDTAGTADGGNITNAALDMGGSGRIEIEARRLFLKNGAKISASTWGAGDSGDIDIRAAEGMTLSGVDADDFSGGIYANSYSEDAGGGNAGNISVETGQARLDGDAIIVSNTFGTGQGGRISLQADALDISEGGILSESYSEEASGGDGGNIEIDASAITLTDQAEISGTTYGGGEAGTIAIRTGHLVLSDGNIFNNALGEVAGSGNAGNIEIGAQDITMTHGAQINSFSEGPGHGGDVMIRVENAFTVSGQSSAGYPSGVWVSSANSSPDAGNAGNIDIRAGQLALTQAATISGNTSGPGNGGSILLSAADSLTVSQGQILSNSYSTETGSGDVGNIDIRAGQTSLTDGAKISATTFGSGKGGTIAIHADTLALSDGSVFSNAMGEVSDSGSAGNIDIAAQDITMTQGSQINSVSGGPGHGGDIVIRAENTFSASGRDEAGYASGIWASSKSPFPGAGNGGTIDIQARQVEIREASISGSTSGPGKGGSIVISAEDSVMLSDAYILSNAYGSEADAGDAGNIVIRSEQFSMQEDSKIAGNTEGPGQGGTIRIQADDTLMLSDSLIVGNSKGTDADAGDGGNIEIEAGQIVLSDGGQINSLSRGPGQGGDIILRVAETLTASGDEALGISSGVFGNSEGEADDSGNAGNIEIIARQITLRNWGKISTSTWGGGHGGRIAIRTTGQISASGDKSGILAQSNHTGSGAGNAGDIEIQAGDVSLKDGAQLVAGTVGGGHGGAIILSVGEMLFISGRSEGGKISAILGSSLGTGDAGSIDIHARNITLTHEGQITSITRDAGQGGRLLIRAEDTIMLSRSIISGSSTGGGDAGDVQISAKEIILTDGGQISNGTRGSGQGGRIRLEAEEQLLVSGTNESDGVPSGVIGTSYGESPDSGDAGDIDIRAGEVAIAGGGQIFSGTFGPGNGGVITIWSAGPMRISGTNPDGSKPSGVIANTKRQGNAGDIEIEAGQLTLEDGAQILGSTSGTGNGGIIHIRVTGVLAISETNEDGDAPSGVLGTSYSTERGAGDAGDIEISARQITLTQGGQIFSGTQGSGNGGTMTIRAEESLTISGINSADNTVSGIYGNSESNTSDSGPGGTILISAPNLMLTDEGKISTSGWGGGRAGDIGLEITHLSLEDRASLSSESVRTENGGAAGKIVIAREIRIRQNDDGTLRMDPVTPASSVRLSNDTRISTDAESSGGGRIVIYAKDMLHLSDSRISTSVNQGSNKGGDISIGTSDTQVGPRFVILNGSQVQANADQGDGGAIFIVTKNYLKSSDSVTEATSRRGNEGSVEVAAPDTDIISGLTLLPANFPDAGQWMKADCEQRSAESKSRFTITGRDALPTAPDDCQASPLPDAEPHP